MNNFQIVKVQPQVLLSICLRFCQFQSGVASKSIAYKKEACMALHKIYQNTGAFSLTGFSRIRTESEILYLHKRMQVRENSHSGIFY